jgi:hypothetical protein
MSPFTVAIMNAFLGNWGTPTKRGKARLIQILETAQFAKEGEIRKALSEIRELEPTV